MEIEDDGTELTIAGIEKRREDFIARRDAQNKYLFRMPDTDIVDSAHALYRNLAVGVTVDRPAVPANLVFNHLRDSQANSATMLVFAEQMGRAYEQYVNQPSYAERLERESFTRMWHNARKEMPRITPQRSTFLSELPPSLDSMTVPVVQREIIKLRPHQLAFVQSLRDGQRRLWDMPAGIRRGQIFAVGGGGFNFEGDFTQAESRIVRWTVSYEHDQTQSIKVTLHKNYTHALYSLLTGDYDIDLDDWPEHSKRKLSVTLDSVPCTAYYREYRVYSGLTIVESDFSSTHQKAHVRASMYQTTCTVFYHTPNPFTKYDDAAWRDHQKRTKRRVGVPVEPPHYHHLRNSTHRF